MSIDLFHPHLGLPFLIVAAVISIAVVAFLYAREQAARSAPLRRTIARRATLGIGGGLVIAFGAWKLLPTNPESPAMLLTYFVSVVLGGGLTLFSVVVLGAALSATPRDEGGVK